MGVPNSGSLQFSVGSIVSPTGCWFPQYSYLSTSLWFYFVSKISPLIELNLLFSYLESLLGSLPTLRNSPPIILLHFWGDVKYFLQFFPVPFEGNCFPLLNIWLPVAPAIPTETDEYVLEFSAPEGTRYGVLTTFFARLFRPISGAIQREDEHHYLKA